MSVKYQKKLLAGPRTGAMDPVCGHDDTKIQEQGARLPFNGNWEKRPGQGRSRRKKSFVCLLMTFVFMLGSTALTGGCSNYQDKLIMGEKTAAAFSDLFKYCPGLESLELVVPDRLPMADALDAVPYVFQFQTRANRKTQSLEIYVFLDKETRIGAEGKIAADAYSVEGSNLTMSWDSTPNIYSTENFIVNYLGNDEEVLRYLENNISDLKKGGLYKGPLTYQLNVMLLTGPASNTQAQAGVEEMNREPGPYIKALQNGHLLAMGIGEDLMKTELYDLGYIDSPALEIQDAQGEKILPAQLGYGQVYTLQCNGELGSEWPVDIFPPMRLVQQKDPMPPEFFVAALSLQMEMEMNEGITPQIEEMNEDPMGKAFKTNGTYMLHFGNKEDANKTVKVFFYTGNATRDLALTGLNSKGTRLSSPNNPYSPTFKTEYFYYKYDHVTVLYEGTHQRLIRALQAVCGKPFIHEKPTE